MALATRAQEYHRPTPRELQLRSDIEGLAKRSPAERVATVRDDAKQLRDLVGPSDLRVDLAHRLMAFALESSMDRETLQAVAGALASAVRDTPPHGAPDSVPTEYQWLADLARYQGIVVDLDAPAYLELVRKEDEAAKRRAGLDWTLKDLDGKAWTLSALKGKVVLVDVWALWCPPCLGELPTIDRVRQRFASEDLVVLTLAGGGDEEAKVRDYVKAHPVGFPTLLDDGQKVVKQYAFRELPHTFVFDRRGALVQETNSAWSEDEFVSALAKAGLKPVDPASPSIGASHPKG